MVLSKTCFSFVVLLSCFHQFSVGQIYDNNRNNRQRNDGRIRCYTCSSQDQANCGDPFFSGQIAAKYCDQYSTNSVHMCFKAVKWFGAGYITTRGCAPFDTETFSVNLQRGMAGTYWKSYDAFSLCENALCNSAPPMIKSYSILLGFILSLFCINL